MKLLKLYILTISVVLFSLALFTACDEGIDVDTPKSTCTIDLGEIKDKVDILEANTKWTIPVNINSSAGVKSAYYKLIAKPAASYVYGSPVNISVSNDKVQTTLNFRITKDLKGILIGALDKDNVFSHRLVMVDSIKVIDQPVRKLTDVEMSTDPADNKCFLALYEQTPIFGRDVALTKQNRIDWVLTKDVSSARPISLHAYGAGDSYYNNSKPYLTGFTELTYLYLSSIRGKIIKEEFDAINTEKDATDLIMYRIIGPKPDGEDYKIPTASRRVGDQFNTTNKSSGGFIIGWGTHTHPTAAGVAVNKTFGLVWVKSVTQKANGHYVIKFDVKYPSYDEREDNNTSSIAPYAPYPL